MTSPSKNNLIQLFTHDEYKDFYGLPCFSDEERSCFFALSLHDKQFINSFRKNQDKIYCLLSLGYFRAKHNLIDFSLNDVTNDQRYIVKIYFPNQKLIKKLPSQAQRIRIQNKILLHENYARLNKTNKDSIESILANLVKRHPKVRPLTKALLQHLYDKRIALPGYSTLQRLITKTLANEQNYIAIMCQKYIISSEQTHIYQLLIEEDSLYPITVIKHDVKDFSCSELTDEIKRHDLLRPLFYIIKTIIKNTEFPKKTIDYYGSLVNFYSVYKLNRMSAQQSHWYLLCYSFERYQKINDNLIQFFQYHVNNFHSEINETVQEKLKQQQHSMHDSLIKAGRVLQLFTENNSKDAIEKKEAFQILPYNHMSIVQQYLMGETRDEELLYWCTVDSIFNRISLYLRKLFLTIDFSISQESELGLAITKLQAALKQPKNIPVYDSCLADCIPKKLLPYLINSDKNKLHWNRFEFFFYKTISSAIKSKKIFLTHSLHYKPLEDELIFKTTWENKKDTS